MALKYTFMHLWMVEIRQKMLEKRYLTQINEKGIKLASMQGRSIGMDRDRRWEKIEHCYKTLTGAGELNSASPS